MRASSSFPGRRFVTKAASTPAWPHPRTEARPSSVWSEQPSSPRWNSFHQLVQRCPHIRSSARQYYARWVLLWQQQGGDEGLAATRSFFEQLGRKSRLRDWQFRQAVHAVELWCRIEPTPEWARSFDWQALAAEAHPLPADHCTLLRESVSVVSIHELHLPRGARRNSDHHPAPGEEEIIRDCADRTRKAVRLAVH